MAETDTPNKRDGSPTESSTTSSRTEREAEEKTGSSDAGAIYVDVSEPATLRYSDTLVIYPKLREAREAWLALPPETKIDASITTDENGGACYRGWDIYRLWAR
jgi:hypothetical protein